jgi:hypothetical protein
MVSMGGMHLPWLHRSYQEGRDDQIGAVPVVSDGARCCTQPGIVHPQRPGLSPCLLCQSLTLGMNVAAATVLVLRLALRCGGGGGSILCLPANGATATP